MKRAYFPLWLICIFFFALPLSISSEEPDNDYSSTYTIDYIELVSPELTVDPYVEPDILFEFGELYSLSFVNYSSSLTGTLRATIQFELDLTSTADFWFLKSFENEAGAFSFDISLFHGRNTGDLDLSSFRLVEGSSYYGDFHVYEFHRTASSYDISGPFPQPYNSTLSYIGYAAIPSDVYTVRVRCEISSSEFKIPLGFFVDYHITNDPVIDFINGDVSFSDAVSNIEEELNSYLDVFNVPVATKHFQIAYADYQLDRLRDASDAKFSTVVDRFESSSDSIVDSYIVSGSTDVLPAVSELNMLYSDALTQAVTPEQGILINSRYNVRLSQIKAVFDVNYKKELDNVLTDQDFSDKQVAIDRTDELLEIESSALQIFEDSNYESYLTFVDWIHTCNYDATVYRSIFEFLFEDPRSHSLQPFLIIPFSLVLAGVILATTTVVFKRRS